MRRGIHCRHSGVEIKAGDFNNLLGRYAIIPRFSNACGEPSPSKPVLMPDHTGPADAFSPATHLSFSRRSRGRRSGRPVVCLNGVDTDGSKSRRSRARWSSAWSCTCRAEFARPLAPVALLGLAVSRGSAGSAACGAGAAFSSSCCSRFPPLKSLPPVTVGHSPRRRLGLHPIAGWPGAVRRRLALRKHTVTMSHRSVDQKTGAASEKAMLTPAQLRAARALIGWSAYRFSEESGHGLRHDPAIRMGWQRSKDGHCVDLAPRAPKGGRYLYRRRRRERAGRSAQKFRNPTARKEVAWLAHSRSASRVPSSA